MLELTQSEWLLGGLVFFLGTAIYVILAVNPAGMFAGSGLGTPGQWAEIFLLQLVGFGAFVFVRRLRGRER
ncbi:hypothetical protein [Halorussus halophilus]|uniref:hypothetical protein n=1 Tax=Halorussus halophilus TaxID=2650975 RepID=UPI0013013976|nr:hypothetical protein [Halorussus halophilus]